MKPLTTKVLAIDAGILNLGWACMRGQAPGRHVPAARRRPQHFEVTTYGSEDTTQSCRVRDCKLPRTNELWDRLAHTHEHVLQEWCHWADHIVLERQPPGGLGEVNAFFYNLYRDKVTKVSPRSVHCFFGIQGFDYDGRKVATTTISRDWVDTDIDCGRGRRVHDVADALAMGYYFLATKAPHPAPSSTSSLVVMPGAWMDRFMYDDSGAR
jgi:hypothetical protein